MSRILRYLAAVMAVSFALASCSKDNPNPEPESSIIDIKASHALGVYYYDDYMGGLSNFYMVMADINIDGDAENPIFDKAGNAVAIDMYVVAPEEGVLPAGTYTYLNNESLDPESFTFSAYSGYSKIANDGMPETEKLLVFVEAALTVNVDNNGIYTFELSAKLEDGRTLHASYVGEMMFESPTIDPDEIFPPMFENTQAAFIDQMASYYGQTDKNAGYFSIQLSDYENTGYNEAGHVLFLNLFSAGDDKTPAAGTYTVASAYDEPQTYAANTIQPGFANMETLQNLGSNITRTIIEGEGINTYYGFIKSGTVTIAKEQDTYTITVDLIDENGFTTKGTYTGALDIRDDSYHSTLVESHEVNVAGMPCEIDYFGQAFADKDIDSDQWTIYIMDDKIKGEGLVIDMLAPHAGFAGKLPAGTYNVTGEYTPNSFMCLPGEYNNGDLYCSWWMGGLEGGLADDIAPFVSGTVTIAKSGETYTISLSVIDDAPVPNTITATWTGVPEFVDASKKPSSAMKSKAAFKTTTRNYTHQIPFRTNLKRHNL